MNRMRRGGRRPRPYVPPQPLMNNQLGLQDIDLELELLKRKREIIEQQQQMLNNDCLSGNRFGEFSHMYEDRGSNGPGSSGAKKRPQVWEHDSPPKRFATGNTSAPVKWFNPQVRAPVKKPNSQAGFQPRSSGFQPRSSGFQPRSDFKPGPNPSIAKKKDFKPNKVTKPSAAPHPNRMRSYSQAERRTLVTEAINSDSLILRADRPASNQLNGRLELALGHIIKEIKAKFPEYEEQFKNNRAIKQSLRDRLRACMMGKQVTVLNDTIRIYRESFPPETDKDLLLNSLETQMGTDFVPIESDNPQEFFTKNLGRLMTKKMEEMFNKLGEMYSNDKPPQSTRQRKPGSTSNKSSSEVVETDDKPKDDDVQVIQDEKENNQVHEIVDIDSETVPNADKSENEEKYKKLMNTEEYKQLDSTMTAMLPFMLKKVTPIILKTLKLDAMYRKTFNGIKQDLRKKISLDGDKTSMPKKLPHLPKPIQKSDVINEDDMKNKEEGDKVEKQKFYQPLPYFVKILGRPSIPKRKSMQSFFKKFNPKSIKKHRTVHNILFVGFVDKQDFDNILAANGTVIGRNTLIIKVSERSKQTLPPSDNTENPDSFITINEELDDQITELLSSIKKSEGLLEDGDVEMTSNETKPEMKAEKQIIINDNEHDIEIIIKNDVGMAENGEVDKQVQENGAIEIAMEENNVGNNKEAVAPAIQVTVEVEGEKPENMTQDNEAQENTEKSNAETENSVPIENKTDKNREEDKGNVEHPQENKDTVEKPQENITENITEIESEKKDTVNELKDVKGTPTRSSARLAVTPSSIRTRRASKLTENNP